MPVPFDYHSFPASQDAVTWTRARGRMQHALLTVPLVALALLLVGCGASGGSNGSTGISVPQNSDNTTHLRLVGSTALLPLAARAADLFHQQHPAVQIEVKGGGSITGLQAVFNHQADIGDSDI